LIKQINRASAETMKEVAQEEGLEPLKLYLSSLMGKVLRSCYPDGSLFSFSWEDEEIPDPQIKADVYSKALGGKAWLTLDEVRGKYGAKPATEEQKAELSPSPSLSPFASQEPAQMQLPGVENPQVDEVMQARRVRRTKRTGRVLRRSRQKPHDSQCVCGCHPVRYP
jgi:hypothetical protein